MIQHKIYYATSFLMRCMSLNKIIACHCFVSLFSPELLYDISLQDNSYPTVNCWCFSVLWKKFDRYMLHYIWFDISPYLTFNVMFDPVPSDTFQFSSENVCVPTFICWKLIYICLDSYLFSWIFVSLKVFTPSS